MKNFTFEQIINERIRELDELMKETAKFSELITYDKKYEGTNNYYFVDRNELALYYTYTNNIMKKIKKLYLMTPFGVHSLDSVIINDKEQLKEKYRDYNDNLIFTINDLEEFKARQHSLAESQLVKELCTSYNIGTQKINSLDGKTQLEFSNNYTYFEHDNFEFVFWMKPEYVCLEGDSLTASQILEIFKQSTFDSNSFSEYFIKRVEMDKGKDLSLELSGNYNVISYAIDKDKNKTREYFDIQKKSEEKKLILTKSKF